jgi:hypothetical protein
LPASSVFLEVNFGLSKPDLKNKDNYMRMPRGHPDTVLKSIVKSERRLALIPAFSLGEGEPAPAPDYHWPHSFAPFHRGNVPNSGKQ